MIGRLLERLDRLTGAPERRAIANDVAGLVDEVAHLRMTAADIETLLGEINRMLTDLAEMIERRSR